MGPHDAKPSSAKRAARTRGERLAKAAIAASPAAIIPPLESTTTNSIPASGILAGDDNCPVIYADSVNFGFSLGGRLRVVFYGGQNGRS